MTLRHSLIAILVMSIWATNFIAGKVALGSFSPFTMLVLRFAISAIVILPFIKLPTLATMKKIFVLSITFGVGHFGLVFLGMKNLDVSSTTLALQAEVPMAALLAAYVFKEQLSKSLIIGMACSVVGVVLISGEPDITNNFSSFLIVLVSAAAWAVATLQMKKLSDVSGFVINGWLSVFTCFHLFILALIFESDMLNQIINAPWPAWGGIAYMAIASTVIAYGLWYWLLKHNPISQVIPYTLLSPLLCVLFGVTLLGETITTQTMIGGAVIISGVAIIILVKPRRRKTARTIEQAAESA